jgi:hypothetical protein
MRVSDNGMSHATGSDIALSLDLPSTTADQLAERQLSFLWAGRIPVGAATLLTGETQTGKSTLLTAVAAAVTTGLALPGGPELEASDVAWLAAEEDPGAVIRPRLTAAGADLGRVHFPGWDGDGNMVRRVRLPSEWDELRGHVDKHGVRLLLIDPIGSFLDAEMAEDNGHTAREVVQSLTNLAQRSGCAVVFVKHPRKGSAGSALDQVSGSKEWINVARSALVLAPEPNDQGKRVLASLKCSVGQKPPTVLFTIECRGGAACVSFGGFSGLTDDDVFRGQGDAVERSMLAQGKALLRDLLEGGERPSGEVKAAALQACISERTLYRAKDELGVTAHPKGPNEKRFWVWRKPDAGWPC